MPALPEDATDRHVARWRNHWILENAEFDDTVEAAVVRMGRIMRYLQKDTKASVAEAGLQDFEYDTLHTLMIRDTPGVASPTALATDLGVSPAGMSGRLESMERAGYVRRTTDPADRRRLGVEATEAGFAIWRQAMAMRGHTEEELLGVLSRKELETLSRLLKKLTVHIEGQLGP